MDFRRPHVWYPRIYTGFSLFRHPIKEKSNKNKNIPLSWEHQKESNLSATIKNSINPVPTSIIFILCATISG